MMARNSKQPLSVLLLDGDHPIALFVARCLSAVPNVRLHALSTEPRAPLRWSRHCHRFHQHVATNDRQLLDVIREVVGEHDIDVLIPVMEKGVEFMSRHAGELAGLVSIPPVPTLDAFRTAVDKGRLASFAESHQIPIPPTVVHDGSLESWQRLERLAEPFVVKPPRGMNGSGICRFSDFNTLRDFLEQQQAAGEIEWVIQSWLPGYDIDCSVLCRNGKIVAHTIQQGIAKGDNEFMPADGIRFVHQDEVLSIAGRLVEALPWNGIAHLDLRRDESTGRVMLLEVNGRFWGTVMGSVIAGINFPWLYCQAALGTPIPPLDYQETVFANAKAAIRSGMRRVFQGDRQDHLPFRNTPLWHGVLDPVAELVRQVQLWRSERSR